MINDRIKTPGRLLALVGLFAFACYGQGDRGLLTGFVKDVSGAVISGASIRAVHDATNVAVTTQSNDNGNFTLNFLPTGEYTVTANKPGFKQFVRTGVKVTVNERLTLNIVMEVGDVKESVNVHAEAELLETTSTSLGTVIDNRRITQLPLMYGNPMMLQFLAAGVIQSGNITYVRPYDTTGLSTASINGARQKSIDFQIDGVTNNNLSNDPAFSPSTEFVQEYKVETAAYDAGQGHGVAFVNATLKSGTNAFHGSSYWYIQDLALNANDYFNNLRGKPRCCDTQYQRYQSSLGGPIRKNRTFFFAGIERIRENGTGSSTQTVPTAAERGGDLSALLKLGSSYQIYDPATTYSTNDGHFARFPFAGNIIPSSRLSPIAQNILKYYPDPNVTGGPADGSNNYYWGTGLSISSYYAALARIDHNFSDKDRLFGRFTYSSRVNGPSSNFFPGASGSYWHFNSRLGALDYTHTFNASTVLDVRYGATYSPGWNQLATEGFDLATLGLPQSLAAQIGGSQKAFPQISMTGFGMLGGSGAYGNKSLFHTLSGVASKVRGRHNMRFGADFRAMMTGQYNYYNNQSVFAFSGGWIRGPADTAPVPRMSGPLAAMLLGIPDSSRLDWSVSSAGINKYTGVFFQDDWKVTDRLTLNLGLRYEYEGAPTERYNRTSLGYDFNTPSPVSAAALAAYALSPIPEIPVSQFQAIGGLTFANVNGQGRGLYHAPTREFMPRIGFAYSIDPKTVLRGGYGIFFDELGLTVQNWTGNQPGFSASTITYPSVDNGLSFPGTLANPFYQGFQKPAAASAGLATYLGNALTVYNQNPRAPYNQRWSFGVQRSLPGNFLLEANYVGSRGTALLMNRNLDATPNQFLSTTRVRNMAVISRLGTQVANPFKGLIPGTSLNNATTSVANLLRPYPHFTAINVMTNEGYSWYHSLQTRVEKRFSQNYTVMGSWTWSKNMSATGLLNAGDPRPERVISADDRTHRLTISGVWDLPFGRGQKIFSNPGRVGGVFANGWQLSPMYTLQTGPALGLGDFLFTGDPTKIVLPRDQRTIDHWFNTAGFVSEQNQQLASNVRYQPTRFSGVRQAPVNQMDMSLVKKTQLTERFNFELRGEAINVFNHCIFGAPNTDPTNPAFGTITGGVSWARRIQIGLVLRY
jgi:hypothetical protein